MDMQQSQQPAADVAGCNHRETVICSISFKSHRFPAIFHNNRWDHAIGLKRFIFLMHL